ncbi:MAG: M20/M25/M40 family metallo-hydrolase [Oscillospiraceae bacterium]|nr:M20/M25/M40 family metallo-hydrolase [Oscillospiraceae bacterium]
MEIKDRLRTNIGVVDIEDSSINKIPGKLSTTVSARGLDEKLMITFMNELISRVQRRLPAINIEVQTERLEQGKPVHLNETLVDVVRRNANEYLALEMWSGAGHDTAYLNEVCAEGAAVFFIPNTGMSHELSEEAEIEDIEIASKIIEKIILERQAK